MAYVHKGGVRILSYLICANAAQLIEFSTVVAEIVGLKLGGGREGRHGARGEGLGPSHSVHSPKSGGDMAYTRGLIMQNVGVICGSSGISASITYTVM
jgi:hypothetical protein